MRLRFIALAASAGVVALAVPVGAVAAAAHGPHKDHGLTITALPNPIIAGEGVTIEGQLTGTDVSGQTIDLYHRIAPNRHYTLIGKTTTNSEGVYTFTRAANVVMTNRSWYVRAPKVAGHVHSETVYERVAAQVSLNAGTATAGTRKPVMFSGTVTPSQRGARVALQVETGADGTHWTTIATTRVRAHSEFRVEHRFATPGDRDLRVRFSGDARNTAAVSDPVTVAVQQAQKSGFSIATSASTVTYGAGGATISGVLDQAGTTTADAGVSVRLWAHTTGHRWHTVQTPQTTGSDGSYSFKVNPSANTVYQVRTTYAPHRTTAPLYLGVHDVVVMNAGATSVTAGQRVRFSGSVSPDKAGSAVYLERMGSDGHWQIVSVRRISHASTYAFTRTLIRTGTDKFRVRVPGDDHTLGGASGAATITVAAASSSAS